MPIDLFNSEIQATVISISYKPKTRIGYLHLAHMHVPDMSGTIKLFTRISPSVQRILVYDGRHLNTQYAKQKGKWACVFIDNNR